MNVVILGPSHLRGGGGQWVWSKFLPDSRRCCNDRGCAGMKAFICCLIWECLFISF